MACVGWINRHAERLGEELQSEFPRSQALARRGAERGPRFNAACISASRRRGKVASAIRRCVPCCSVSARGDASGRLGRATGAFTPVSAGYARPNTSKLAQCWVSQELRPNLLPDPWSWLTRCQWSRLAIAGVVVEIEETPIFACLTRCSAGPPVVRHSDSIHLDP